MRIIPRELGRSAKNGGVESHAARGAEGKGYNEYLMSEEKTVSAPEGRCVPAIWVGPVGEPGNRVFIIGPFVIRRAVKGAQAGGGGVYGGWEHGGGSD